ncbi:MAG: hypothetical protein ABI488_17390 [Polyangiaceae bacterium]
MRVVCSCGLSGFALLGACSSGGKGNDTPASIIECTVKAPTACPDPPLTYPDVAPLFQSKCVSACHNGTPNGPWPLDAYQDAADWQDTIRDDLLDCSMPPADSGVAVSDEDRVAILTWVRCGALK